MQKIGVFVCWCGSNIAATVDVKAVAEAVKAEPGVVFSTDYQYMCSENGQAMIRQQGKNYMKPTDIPALLDEKMPQQALVSAMRKYSK